MKNELGNLILVFGFSLIGTFVGRDIGIHSLQREAIKAGHAEFVVVDKMNPTCQFRWITNSVNKQ